MGDLAIFNLKEYREKHNLGTFVETGTFKGDAVQHAINSGFSCVHSVEIIKELSEKAKERFSATPNIFIHNGVSGQVLKDLLPTINDNILFWLDAHFPGVDAGLSKYEDEQKRYIRIPLESEIRQIAKRCGKFKDVLIIDDLRMYEDGDYEWGNWNDRTKFGGANARFIYNSFKDTHNIEKSNKHQGYLIITPK